MPAPDRAFGAHSTTDDVLGGMDLHGISAVVTGAGSGVGLETARALCVSGADVTLAVRRPSLVETMIDGWVPSDESGRARVRGLDLSDPSSIATFVEQWDGPLDLLVNNAGVMGLPDRAVDARGFEQHFAVNYLGHLRLTVGLRRALSQGGGGRVVSISSSSHMRSPVVFDDLSFERRSYEPALAYAQSKTACSLLAVGVGRRWAEDGVTANAVHPGIIHTGLQRHLDNWQPGDLPTKTITQGAATQVWAATAPEIHGLTGTYFADCAPAQVVALEDADILEPVVVPHALDPDAADRLWDLGEAALS